MCRFHARFVALCDHNASTLQTDGRTDERYARSISATYTIYDWHVALKMKLVRFRLMVRYLHCVSKKRQ